MSCETQSGDAVCFGDAANHGGNDQAKTTLDTIQLLSLICNIGARLDVMALHPRALEMKNQA